MTETASFQLRLTGDLTDEHKFQAYDGFSSLAGVAWTLSLVTNYVETATIRHRGNFVGRHAVLATPMRPGSLIADFSVLLQTNPGAVFGIALSGATASSLLYGLVHRVVTRNLGDSEQSLNQETKVLVEKKRGDVEALVAMTEPSLRQAHEVIGNGAEQIDWVAGFNTIAVLDGASKEYIKGSVYEDIVIEREVSVNGFYGNTGHGSVYDGAEGRVVPFGMSVDTLRAMGAIFSWGLDQYMNKTGKKIRIHFTRVTATNGRTKRYKVIHASIPADPFD